MKLSLSKSTASCHSEQREETHPCLFASTRKSFFAHSELQWTAVYSAVSKPLSSHLFRYFNRQQNAFSGEYSASGPALCIIATPRATVFKNSLTSFITKMGFALCSDSARRRGTSGFSLISPTRRYTILPTSNKARL